MYSAEFVSLLEIKRNERLMKEAMPSEVLSTVEGLDSFNACSRN